MSIDNINDYISNLPEIAKKSVSSFTAFMEIEFPQITPKICFAMPMWWAGQKMYDGYVAVSGAKKHFSIHFHDERYIEELKAKLSGCSFGKKCINIKYGDEFAFSETKQIVKKYFSSVLK